MKVTKILHPTDIEILWSYLKHLIRDTSPPGVLQIEMDVYDHGKNRYITYSNHLATQLASRYCKERKNTCGVYFSGSGRSDCAHFLAHCLHAGGLTIKSSESECPHGLSMRVKEIVTALSSLNMNNVRRVAIDDAILGTPAFLNNVVEPFHAIMIRKAGDKSENTTFFAHSRENCGEKPVDLPLYQSYGVGFRLEDYKVK